ncbi:DUF1810 domain-containing protein [Croceicoccus naphthovorans]|uniref:Calpastatin n=1 Tax=Croceicoccus naphthovorans TaxID=1348774 RepID=A0A0G3XGS5_9SPHN|nr:DUF1810 domain-containing protein [Croceicoccus naphthovorans]AKM09824.1 calpastatin [Croceicoccus naphthovorans]MBB3991260.1 uncharacterized protein (DUF1810 family) [Croceicoccus naphthovorans]
MPNLSRFVEAQDGIYADALDELRAGQKRTHWMWFVFPQLVGLGRSDTARFYGISGLDEARAYVAHDVLGPRLEECCDAVLDWWGRKSSDDMFGPIDSVKLRSSMTLFERAARKPEKFGAVLEGFYAGTRDLETLRRLA